MKRNHIHYYYCRNDREINGYQFLQSYDQIFNWYCSRCIKDTQLCKTNQPTNHMTLNAENTEDMNIHLNYCQSLESPVLVYNEEILQKNVLF